MNNKKPTEETYAELQQCYDFYNAEFFDGLLPHCLITLQREKTTMGYFSRRRFVRSDGSQQTDEIALNPEYFAVVPVIEVLQTIVHEMIHLWQFHFGTPSRACYHNSEWSLKMQSVGLMPSDTGLPGGKRTGQKIADYPIEGGRFVVSTQKLLDSGFSISWLDRFPARPPAKYQQLPVQPATMPQHWNENTSELDEEDATATEVSLTPGTVNYSIPAYQQPALDLEARGQENRSNRSKYTCPQCNISVWGKPKLHVKCGDCDVLLADETADLAVGRLA